MFNQAVAPPGNAALPGLAMYATAQGTEQMLAESLTGDPAVDGSVLATIKSDVLAGTQLNEYNLGNVSFLDVRWMDGWMDGWMGLWMGLTMCSRRLRAAISGSISRAIEVVSGRGLWEECVWEEEDNDVEYSLKPIMAGVFGCRDGSLRWDEMIWTGIALRDTCA